MSKYYNIQGLKVRVSDHEPNFAAERMRGRNDLELYTHTLEGNKISVPAQIEKWCERNDMEPELFEEVANDFPEVGYTPRPEVEKIVVSKEIAGAYKAIKGRGRMRKQDKFCERHNLPAYKMSQGLYKIE